MSGATLIAAAAPRSFHNSRKIRPSHATATAGWVGPSRTATPSPSTT